jgi:malonyl-CoA/methylmalonyl-CoA synthetase
VDSIVEAVLGYAEQSERPALWFPPERPEIAREFFTYRRLAAEVECFARALLGSGIRPGDRVALFLETSPDFVVAYLGTHLARAIVVPVNTEYREVELTHLLRDAGVRLCVTTAAGADILRQLSLPGELTTLVLVGHGQGAAGSGETGAVPESAAGDSLARAPQRVSFSDFVAKGAASGGYHLELPGENDPAIIAYTSGTTGRAKGALLTHRNLVSNISAVTTTWRWTESDRLLLVLPLFHGHGLMVGLHGTLFLGATAIVRRRFVAAEVLSTLQDPEAGVTLFFGVPTMYARLVAEAEEHPEPLRPLRLYVSGSAPLSPQLFFSFLDRFGQRILERYGMTETIMNMSNPYDGDRRPGTVGLPFPGQLARIVDLRTRCQLPAGETGEIEVRGPNVFTGYWNRPEATSEAFSSDGWFKTGDLGWCSPDGYYTITGRARELIITGGYNVYPREVEDVLGAIPEVAEVAVLGLPDADLGEQVAAVIVPKSGCSPNPNQLIAYCREHLAAYKKPRRVIFVESLPRNALGKVQKHLLLARVLQQESDSDATKPG